MGTIRPSEPVKFFAGVLIADADLLPQVRECMVAVLGPIDQESGPMAFNFTDYYAAEMGDRLERVFFSFENLAPADSLPALKLETNRIEEGIAAAFDAVRRPVNIDPGYVEQAKIVLASTKNFYHRTYVGHGIFAEVTMHFRNNRFQFFPWTYPDYKSAPYQDFFLHIRRIYRKQLKDRSGGETSGGQS